MEIDELARAAAALMTRECNLVAAYAVGSLATGDLVGAASDVDLLLVTDQDLPVADRVAAGDALADLAMSAPGRGLEAVVYRAEVLARPRHPLAYELNVNAGRAMRRSVTTAGDPAFWFLLDVAAARQHAVALLGPPVKEVIGEVADADIKTALQESLRWHRTYARPDADAVLTACRGLHWLATGSWASKSHAGEAYLEARHSDVVSQALILRQAGVDGDLEPAAVHEIQVELEAALHAPHS